MSAALRMVANNNQPKPKVSPTRLPPSRPRRKLPRSPTWRPATPRHKPMPKFGGTPRPVGAFGKRAAFKLPAAALPRAGASLLPRFLPIVGALLTAYDLWLLWNEWQKPYPTIDFNLANAGWTMQCTVPNPEIAAWGVGASNWCGLEGQVPWGPYGDRDIIPTIPRKPITEPYTESTTRVAVGPYNIPHTRFDHHQEWYIKIRWYKNQPKPDVAPYYLPPRLPYYAPWPLPDPSWPMLPYTPWHPEFNKPGAPRPDPFAPYKPWPLLPGWTPGKYPRAPVQTRPKGEPGIGIGPDGPFVPKPHTPTKPNRNTKERKGSGAGGKGGPLQKVFRAAQKAMRGLTEAGDAIEAVYKALPKGKQTCKGDMTCMAKAIWNNVGAIDIDQALYNLAANEVQDRLLGKAHGKASKGASKLGVRPGQTYMPHSNFR